MSLWQRVFILFLMSVTWTSCSMELQWGRSAPTHIAVCVCLWGGSNDYQVEIPTSYLRTGFTEDYGPTGKEDFFWKIVFKGMPQHCHENVLVFSPSEICDDLNGYIYKHWTSVAYFLLLVFILLYFICILASFWPKRILQELFFFSPVID